jgi:hypothetical protein
MARAIAKGLPRWVAYFYDSPADWRPKIGEEVFVPALPEFDYLSMVKSGRIIVIDEVSKSAMVELSLERKVDRRKQRYTRRHAFDFKQLRPIPGVPRRRQKGDS